MRCPYCQFEGSRADLHGHLAGAHPEAVPTRLDEQGHLYYSIRCPYCDFQREQRVKPRWQDPGFLVEFRREIVLVAFDQLLYHLEGVHGGAGRLSGS